MTFSQSMTAPSRAHTPRSYDGCCTVSACHPSCCSIYSLPYLRPWSLLAWGFADSKRCRNCFNFELRGGWSGRSSMSFGHSIFTEEPFSELNLRYNHRREKPVLEKCVWCVDLLLVLMSQSGLV